MKKLFKFVIIIFLLVQGTGHSQFIKRVNIGAQYWRASQNYYHEGFGVNIADQPGNLFGPDLLLRIGGLTIGSSMFFGSFNWSIVENDVPVEMNVQRNYIDFSLGFVYMENFNFFAIMKNLSFEGEKSHSDLENRDYRIKAEDKGTHFGVGFSSVYSFPQSSILVLTYASYTSGRMKTALTQYIKDIPDDELGGAWHYKSAIASVMLGLGYQFDNGLSILLSYRKDTSNRQVGELRLQGPILTLSYIHPPRE